MLISSNNILAMENFSSFASFGLRVGLWVTRPKKSLQLNIKILL